MTVLLGLELSFRILGHRPSVRDSLKLWSFHRQRVQPEQVVLLGASRIQLGFSLSEFRKRYPNTRVSMLAVAATSPAGALEDICNDESFNGLVICSLPDMNTLDKEQVQQMAAHIDFPKTAPFYSPIEAMLESAVTSSFVVAHERLGIKNIAREFAMKGRLPASHHIAFHIDRTGDSDFEAISAQSLKRLRQRYLNSYADVNTEAAQLKWYETLQSVKQNVEKLQARGGRIAFIFMPIDDDKYKNIEAFFPRKLFWDELEKQTGASTLHFKDIPDMDVPTPDLSHVDQRDKDRLTGFLLDQLETKGLLPITTTDAK